MREWLQCRPQIGRTRRSVVQLWRVAGACPTVMMATHKEKSPHGGHPLHSRSVVASAQASWTESGGGHGCGVAGQSLLPPRQARRRAGRGRWATVLPLGAVVES